jgi:hypothetical protein
LSTAQALHVEVSHQQSNATIRSPFATPSESALFAVLTGTAAMFPATFAPQFEHIISVIHTQTLAPDIELLRR